MKRVCVWGGFRKVYYPCKWLLFALFWQSFLSHDFLKSVWLDCSDPYQNDRHPNWTEKSGLQQDMRALNGFMRAPSSINTRSVYSTNKQRHLSLTISTVFAALNVCLLNCKRFTIWPLRTMKYELVLRVENERLIQSELKVWTICFILFLFEFEVNLSITEHEAVARVLYYEKSEHFISTSPCS